MPRSPEYRNCAQRTGVSPICAGLVGLLGLLGLPLVSCEDEYSLPPTFCDDWCRATLLPTCDEDPEDCVEHCELTLASEGCFPLQRELLGCYETAGQSALSCVGSGFAEEIRVAPEVCARERDALFECEAPGIGQCLGSCRATQARQLRLVAPGETSPVDFGLLGRDAGGEPSCPALDRPCEDLCWSVFGLRSAGLEAIGIVTEASDLDDALACLQRSLLGCLAAPGVQDAGLVSNSDPPESIGDAIARCGGAIALP